MRQLSIIVLLIIYALPSPSQCVVPHYRKIGNLKLSWGTTRISIPQREFTLGNVICLVQKLKDEHPGWNSVSLLMFSSYQDAKDFAEHGVEDVPVAKKLAATKLRAMYYYNNKENKDHLIVLPFGNDTPTAYATIINFPVKEAPRCVIEIKHRCLFASQQFVYPEDALIRRTSGAVELVGDIDVEGRITNASVRKAEVTPKEEESLLSQDALKNFESWQLDPGGGPTSVTITYSYVIDGSLDHGQSNVKIDSNNHVVVRGNP